MIWSLLNAALEFFLPPRPATIEGAMLDVPDNVDPDTLVIAVRERAAEGGIYRG